MDTWESNEMSKGRYPYTFRGQYLENGDRSYVLNDRQYVGNGLQRVEWSCAR